VLRYSFQRWPPSNSRIIAASGLPAGSSGGPPGRDGRALISYRLPARERLALTPWRLVVDRDAQRWERDARLCAAARLALRRVDFLEVDLSPGDRPREIVDRPSPPTAGDLSQRPPAAVTNRARAGEQRVTHPRRSARTPSERGAATRSTAIPRSVVSGSGHAGRAVSGARGVCFAQGAVASPARRTGRESPTFSWT
jgi:hypothetical protein